MKKFGQFLGLWLIIIMFFLSFDLIPTNFEDLNFDDSFFPLLGSFGITFLIYVGYLIGYEQGEKETELKRFKETFVSPFEKENKDKNG